MVYGELGVFPLSIDIQSRMFFFFLDKTWCYGKNKIASSLYKLVRHLNEQRKINSKWLVHVEHLVNSNGFGNIWDKHDDINAKGFIKSFKQKLVDQYKQNWNSLVDISSRGINYRIFKDNFQINIYFSFLSNRQCKILTAFRTRNHHLPVEVGRWRSIPLNERVCMFCVTDIGGEYHYIMTCNFFNSQRMKFVKPYYYRNPNTIKFNALMNQNHVKQMKLLCSFIEIIMKEIRQINT